MLFIVSILCFLIPVPELQAPEITEHDMHGYDTYRVAEDGAIVDRDGAIKGWVHGNTVYDAQWNEKYIILEKATLLRYRFERIEKGGICQKHHLVTL